jgi:hypothetical protein
MTKKPFTVTMTVNYHTHAETAQLALDSARTNLPSAFDLIEDEVKETGADANGILACFKSTEYEWDEFSVNDCVNVFPKYEGDEFTEQFVGTVIDKIANRIIVEDEDGEVFTLDPDQVSFNTDAIMHGK